MVGRGWLVLTQGGVTMRIVTIVGGSHPLLLPLGLLPLHVAKYKPLLLKTVNSQNLLVMSFLDSRKRQSISIYQASLT